jgi:hypothetical protein
MPEAKEKFVKLSHNDRGWVTDKPAGVLEMLEHELANADPGETFTVEVIEEYPSVVNALPEFDGF